MKPMPPMSAASAYAPRRLSSPPGSSPSGGDRGAEVVGAAGLELGSFTSTPRTQKPSSFEPIDEMMADEPTGTRHQNLPHPPPPRARGPATATFPYIKPVRSPRTSPAELRVPCDLEVRLLRRNHEAARSAAMRLLIH
jgi:hypothetical protein